MVVYTRCVVQDMGVIVSGKIEAGSVKIGQELMIMPNQVQGPGLASCIEHGLFRSSLTRMGSIWPGLLAMQHRCEVSSIAVEEEDVDEAKAGDNVRLKLKNCEEEVHHPCKIVGKRAACTHNAGSLVSNGDLGPVQDLSTVFVLCHPRSLVKTARVFEAHLAIVEHKNIICAGFKAVLHIHTCVEEVTITVWHSPKRTRVVTLAARTVYSSSPAPSPLS